MYPVPPFRPLATYIKIDIYPPFPQKKKKNMGSQICPYIDYIHLLRVACVQWHEKMCVWGRTDERMESKRMFDFRSN